MICEKINSLSYSRIFLSHHFFLYLDDDSVKDVELFLIDFFVLIRKHSYASDINLKIPHAKLLIQITGKRNR